MRIRRQIAIATSLCLILLAQAGMLLLGNRGWAMAFPGIAWEARKSQKTKLFNHQPFQVLSSANLFNSKSIKENDRNQEINSKLMEANTKFSFKLFSEISKNQANQNILISPTSIESVLAIAYNGANGETQQAIGKTLELQGLTLQELNMANAALKAALQNPDPKVQLSIANSLWAKNDEPFKSDFIQKINKFYSTAVKNINFTDPNSTSIINNWVNQSTKGKIKEIVDRFDSNTVFVILNAIYFEGNWTQPFPTSGTESRPFNLLNGTKKMHPMMSRVFYSPIYSENEILQAIRLPYGEERLAMYIFLPKPNVNWERFSQLLTAENWHKWINELTSDSPNYGRYEAVLLRLPRVKLEYEIDLKNTLEKLGMGIAFAQNADFSAMTNLPLWISQAKHKTFIEVNEEGTVAAAVTMGGGTRSGIDSSMIVDRPFFYVIRDDQTETILFMGSVVNPQ